MAMATASATKALLSTSIIHQLLQYPSRSGRSILRVDLRDWPLMKVVPSDLGH
jgi:hypothetical protein